MKDLKSIISITQTLKLLYVEDNEEMRETALEILSEFFSDIIVAVDGLDGLEKFQAHHFDLIITDITMPNMNGLEMLEKIYENNQDVLSLIFSAYNEEKYFTQSIKLGVEGYLLKPIEFEQFINVLDKITQKVEALR